LAAEVAFDRKDNITNQWGEGGNSYVFINIVFKTLACVLPVSASLISIVQPAKRSNKALHFNKIISLPI
jgi:hypothetical protein